MRFPRSSLARSLLAQPTITSTAARLPTFTRTLATPTPTMMRPTALARPSALLSNARPSLLTSSPTSSPILSLLVATSQQPQQVRYATYGAEYQPSQVRRKRKHGFLSRKRTRSGRKTLERRWSKGRKFLSH